ncbi:MAG: hypothetical protein KGQ70_06105 [Alphaproteobacteria bacterium]|nr:hypothetical protein [Alphaproteobacteria bacterium]
MFRTNDAYDAAHNRQPPILAEGMKHEYMGLSAYSNIFCHLRPRGRNNDIKCHFSIAADNLSAFDGIVMYWRAPPPEKTVYASGGFRLGYLA